MALLLNKKISLIVCFLLVTFLGFSQSIEEFDSPKDYKDPVQFEKFRKRRMVIAAWQINQLKNGAIVVRLKTNQKLIDGLNKQGKTTLADEKRLEQFAINLNTMRAYINNYTFSKVYFIYSYNSDSLLNGVRANIFLDTTLNVDPKIVMSEKFYLLAERDYAYNSSIGFVPEDSARVQTERGNAVKEVPIVMKNKYGHQLKGPFPYYSGERFDQQKKVGYVTYITINGISIPFNIGGTKSSRGQKSFKYNGVQMTANIPKHYTYQKISASVERMNEHLKQFYQSNPKPEEDKIAPEVKPFLY